VELHAGDFNSDSVLDPLLTYYINGKSYPAASRDELLDQISPLRKKFIKYEDYAKATIDDIATKDQLEKSQKFKAVELHSSWLENMNGKDFKLRPLPDMAQVSSMNAFLFDDINTDGDKDLLLAGNFYPYKPQLGKSDASVGLVLKYKKGAWEKNKSATPVWLGGDIRDMAMLRFKNGQKRLVVSRNNENASVFSPAN
jgi:hypothetical protein